MVPLRSPSAVSVFFYLSLVSRALAAGYTLTDEYTPTNFFNKFHFDNSPDSTHGHVQYVDKAYAQANDLVKSFPNYVFIGPDQVDQYPRGGPGRPSVRLVSQNTYTHGLFILDLNHMPGGCGIWPAFWTSGDNWPSEGEIDIIEGVNLDSKDAMSLHAAHGCRYAGSNQTGTLQSQDCDSSANGGKGCVARGSDSSFGTTFNSNNGGVYAMQWTSDFIKIWYFTHTNVPADVTSGNPDPINWPLPAANFAGSSCDIDRFFKNHRIIINTDFCGDWAGRNYGASSCPQTPGANGWESCVDFVGDNPGAMSEAYWMIKSLRVYQDNASGSAASVAQYSRATTATVNVPQQSASRTANFYSGPNTISRTRTTAPTGSFSCSSKRGLAHVDTSHPQDNSNWILPGSELCWYWNYDWTPTYSYEDSRMQYVPMLWGDFPSTFRTDVIAMIDSGRDVSHVLSFNEPDLPFSQGGSQMTPERAAVVWANRLEPLVQRGVKLGAPAITGTQRGIDWLTSFFDYCAGSCTVDFLTVHFRGPLSSMQSHIASLQSAFPDVSDIWVTEYAYDHQSLPDTQANAADTLNWFDQSSSPIQRYSYYGAFRSSDSTIGPNAAMLTCDGRLTNLGARYIGVESRALDLSPDPALCDTTSSATRTTASRTSDQGSTTTAGPIYTECPNANGTTYVSPGGARFVIICDQDTLDHDLSGPHEQHRITDCLNLCADTPFCKVGSFRGAGCYLKSAVGPTQSNNGNIVGICTANCNSGITFTRTTTSTSRSTVVTTSTPGPGTITSSHSDPTGAPTTTTSRGSGTTTSAAASVGSNCPGINGTVITLPCGAKYQMLCDLVTSDHDLGTGHPEANYVDCLNACAGTADCVAAQFAGGGCYLKQGIGRTDNYIGSIEGICVDNCDACPRITRTSATNPGGPTTASVSSSSTGSVSSTRNGSSTSSSSGTSISSSDTRPSTTPSSSISMSSTRTSFSSGSPSSSGTFSGGSTSSSFNGATTISSGPASSSPTASTRTDVSSISFSSPSSTRDLTSSGSSLLSSSSSGSSRFSSPSLSTTSSTSPKDNPTTTLYRQPSTFEHSTITPASTRTSGSSRHPNPTPPAPVTETDTLPCPDKTSKSKHPHPPDFITDTATRTSTGPCYHKTCHHSRHPVTTTIRKCKNPKPKTITLDRTTTVTQCPTPLKCSVSSGLSWSKHSSLISTHHDSSSRRASGITRPVVTTSQVNSGSRTSTGLNPSSRVSGVTRHTSSSKRNTPAQHSSSSLYKSSSKRSSLTHQSSSSSYRSSSRPSASTRYSSTRSTSSYKSSSKHSTSTAYSSTGPLRTSSRATSIVTILSTTTLRPRPSTSRSGSNRVSTSTISGSTSLPNCPSDDYGVHLSGLDKTYAIHCQQYYTRGESVDMQTQDSLGACIAACDLYNSAHFVDGTVKCRGVSYFRSGKPPGESNCFLQGRISFLIPYNGVDSAQLLDPHSPPESPKLHRRKDILTELADAPTPLVPNPVVEPDVSLTGTYAPPPGTFKARDLAAAQLPSSQVSSCRTYPTNYLNGARPSPPGFQKRSIFDIDEAGVAQPVPQEPWYV